MAINQTSQPYDWTFRRVVWATLVFVSVSQQGTLTDIVVGVIGVFLTGYFLSPLFGVGTINDVITL